MPYGHARRKRVNQKNNSFCISVYRKPTFTGLGLRFDSFVPKSYKYNLISSLIHRAYKIFSNFQLFHLKIVKLRKFFSANFYPQYLFDKFLNNYLDRNYSPKKPTVSVPKLNVYMSLPLMGDHSYHCKKTTFPSY